MACCRCARLTFRAACICLPQHRRAMHPSVRNPFREMRGCCVCAAPAQVSRSLVVRESLPPTPCFIELNSRCARAYDHALIPWKKSTGAVSPIVFNACARLRRCVGFCRVMRLLTTLLVLRCARAGVEDLGTSLNLPEAGGNMQQGGDRRQMQSNGCTNTCDYASDGDLRNRLLYNSTQSVGGRRWTVRAASAPPPRIPILQKAPAAPARTL